MAEYAILLAITTGMRWVAELPRVITESPGTALAVGAGVVVALGWVLGIGRR